MLIHNAEIEAESRSSLRVLGGRITARGRHLEAHPGEPVIDAQGGALLPGLHDHHLHLLALAAARVSLECGPPALSTRHDFESALQQAAALRDPETWIRGVGYFESVAGDLDRWQLDPHTGSVPTRIQHRSGALWILNSRAVERLGVEATRGEPGVEVDHSGAVTGRLFGRDRWLRERLGVPDAPALHDVSRELAAYGVTGLTDATPHNGSDEARLFSRAQSEGQLLQSLRLMGGRELMTTAFPAVGERKLLLREDTLPTFEALCADIRFAHAHQRGVAIHCVTHAELVFALEAFAAAGVRPGDRVEHAAIAAPAAVARLATLGICVVTQPNFIAERGDAYATDVASCDRPYLYRGRGFLDAGVALGGGTDAPFGHPDPWRAMRAAVDRKSAGGAVFAADEALSPERALRLFTSRAEAPGGAARALLPGAPADLCLLDRDWRAARERLSSDCVRLTLCAGVPAFGGEEAPTDFGWEGGSSALGPGEAPVDFGPNAGQEECFREATTWSSRISTE